jgi:hypothetical protein
LAAPRAYAGRSTIAILGLEVSDPNGQPTTDDVKVAKELTNDLRSRAMTGSGPYDLAKNSDKELVEEKLLRSCDSEAPTCMQDIGKDVGGDFLLYGKLTKKSGSYQVSLNLLDVSKGMQTKRTRVDQLPVGMVGTELQDKARQWYANLTGEKTTGTLSVKLANGDHGTILIDRAEKGSITNGSGQVPNLDEGKHKLRVEAEGYHPAEQDVTVNAGETRSVTITLEKREQTGGTGSGPGAVTGTGGTGMGPGAGPGPAPGGGAETATRGSTGWKVVAGGAVALSAGAAVYGFHAQNRMQAWQNFECFRGDYLGVANPPNGCVEGAMQKKDTDANILSANRTGKDWAIAANTSAGIAIASGALALVAIYEGFIAKHDSSSTPNEHAVRGRRVHRDRFVVTPVMSANGGGATLRIDW